jgi:predicted enzyme related to lactoylglutathione lyase
MEESMSEPTMPTGYRAFCWNQLNTPDVAASKAFYAELFGWTSTAQATDGGFVYHLQHRGTDQVAGMMAMVAPLGGVVCVPVTDIQIGRFAVLRDPVGATLSVFQGA